MKVAIKTICIVFALAVSLFNSASGQDKDDIFSISDEFRPWVSFWKDIFGKYDSRHAIIHDRNYPYLVYEVIKLDHPTFSKAARRQIKREINILKKKLAELQQTINSGDEPEGDLKELYNIFVSMDLTDYILDSKMPQNIRYQIGIKDRFLKGYRRSGRYSSYIKEELKKHNMPEQLWALPFVESTYNPHAVSKVGAKGLWQIMRPIGRLFLRIDEVYDARFDPFDATLGAIGILKMNYENLGSWPLAILAYNYGLGGVKLAVEKTGSDRIEDILKYWEGRRFGFAAKNFYTEFLAVLEILKEKDGLLSGVTQDDTMSFKTIKLKGYVALKDLVKYTAMSKRQLIQYNPGFTDLVKTGDLLIPPDLSIKIPKRLYKRVAEDIASLPGKVIKSRQKHLLYYTIKKGDTIYYIAKRFKISQRAILDANRVNPRRLLPGMKIKLPLGIAERGTQFLKKKMHIRRVASRTAVPVSKDFASKVVDSGKRILKKWAISSSIDFLRPRDKRIMVLPLETLGHYADWCEMKTQRLREANHMGRSSRIVVGQIVSLAGCNVSEKIFTKKRLLYFTQVLKTLDDRVDLERIEEISLLPGESLATLSERVNLPTWVVLLYNYDKLNATLYPGDRVRIPLRRR